MIIIIIILNTYDLNWLIYNIENNNLHIFCWQLYFENASNSQASASLKSRNASNFPSKCLVFQNEC